MIAVRGYAGDKAHKSPQGLDSGGFCVGGVRLDFWH